MYTLENFPSMVGDTNDVSLQGRIHSPVKLDHETERGAIYVTEICVERKSGVEDIIPVYIKENTLAFLSECPKVGDLVEIKGFFHSKDVYVEANKRKLRNYVHAEKIGFCQNADLSVNRVVLSGEICKSEEMRKTLNGKELICFLLKVRRKNHRFSRIPCVVWGASRAVRIAEAGIGAKLELCGHIQSREYTKDEDGVKITRTVYEVSVTYFEIK